MIRLRRLVRDHPDAVEAHLSQVHSTDLRGLWSTPRTLTWRRLAVLTRWLPDDSPLAIAERGSDWTRRDDQMDVQRMLLQSLNGAKKVEPDPRSPRHEANRRLDPGLGQALDRIDRIAAEREAHRREDR